VTATACDTGFVAHAPAFEEVTGEDPRLSRLAEVDAHEGPVYFPDENALYFMEARVVRINLQPVD
jgi:sugar lactone lactonase YvrE